MSNQSKGADAASCPWCIAWNAAKAAASLDLSFYDGRFHLALRKSLKAGERLMKRLATRETDCPDCQRSAEIYRGEVLGHEAAKWRAAMWQDNPSMHFMMRPGKGDTFGKAG